MFSTKCLAIFNLPVILPTRRDLRCTPKATDLNTAPDAFEFDFGCAQQLLSRVRASFGEFRISTRDQAFTRVGVVREFE